MRYRRTPVLDRLGEAEFTITPRTRMNLTPHYVYVVRGAENVVLYVGQTRNVPGRMASHRKLAPWWKLYRTIDCYRCESRQHALQIELALIVELSPRYNYQTLAPGLATSVSVRFAEVGKESVETDAA